MENNELYEVTRDEYAGFLNQIKPDARLSEQTETDKYIILKTYSVKDGTLFCSHIVPLDDEEEHQYYVYNMPQDDERCAPQVIWKLQLETKEEVQAFFDVLNKIQKGDLND